MSEPAAIQAQQVSYSYPDGTVGIAQVTLSVPEGSCVALLGANGTGKSTLLLCLMGVLDFRGRVRILGEELTRKTRRRIHHKMGLVFQDPDDQLFCPTVLDDLAFGPLNLGWPPEKVRGRISHSLAVVGMEGFEQRMPHHLSHGEKKRIAIATVLAMEPQVLLLDEPTAGLDPRSASSLIDVLMELKEAGRTLLVATHDLHLVGEIADRVVILGWEKEIVKEGDPQELLCDRSLLVENNLLHEHRHRHAGAIHRHPHQHGHSHPHEEEQLAGLLMQQAVALHGHRGPYLALGVRMGMAAKKKLGLRGHFDVQVSAYTGRKPPISCIIDGLQVSTGATAGKGNLKVCPQQHHSPAVKIQHQQQGLLIRLKPELQRELTELLSQGNQSRATELVLSLSEEKLLHIDEV
jgi:cobalt/nickel transport system ATP-binding protein